MTTKTSDVVYIVIRGEKNEGGSIKAVMYNADDAESFALAIERHWPDHPWKLTSKAYPMRWENACDFVQVEEHYIQ